MCSHLDSFWGDSPAPSLAEQITDQAIDEAQRILNDKEVDENAKATYRAKDVRTPFHGRPMDSHREHQSTSNVPKE